MDIAVLGTGVVGREIAGRLVGLGHTVTLGTRDPEATASREEYAAWAATAPGARLATFADAAAAGELVVNASGGAVTLDVLEAARDHLAGKVLLDLSNPLDFSGGFPPTLFVKDDDSLAERVQRAFPEARVVKTLNTLTATLMVHPEQLPDPGTVFVCGDDPAAKADAIGLLTAFGHLDVLDLGDLANARGPEMFLAFWVRMMGALGTPLFNIKVVR